MKTKQTRNYKNNEVVDFQGKRNDQISISEAIIAVAFLVAGIGVIFLGVFKLFFE